jgi:predicted GNAT family acetyltransferase
VSQEKLSMLIRDNPEGHAYEALVHGEVIGILGYNNAHERRVLTHTSIDPEYRHQGIAHRIITYALDDMRAHHRTVTNICPIVTDFIREHPEYTDLIDPVHPGRA